MTANQNPPDPGFVITIKDIFQSAMMLYGMWANPALSAGPEHDEQREQLMQSAIQTALNMSNKMQDPRSFSISKENHICREVVTEAIAILQLKDQMDPHEWNNRVKVFMTTAQEELQLEFISQEEYERRQQKSKQFEEDTNIMVLKPRGSQDN